MTIAALHEGPTPRQIAENLFANKTDVSSDLIIPIQPNGHKPPIFGVHVLGSNEEFFRPLAASLGREQPVLGLSVGPLVEGVPTGVKETAQAYAKALQAYQPKGSICLAAVSQGSYVAFELAQQLRKAGREVALLALFDAAGPGGRARIKGLARIWMHLKMLRQNGPRYFGTLIVNRLENRRNQIEKRRVARSLEKGDDSHSITTVEAFVAANTLAIENYSVQPYHGRLTVFRAQESVIGLN